MQQPQNLARCGEKGEGTSTRNDAILQEKWVFGIFAKRYSLLTATVTQKDTNDETYNVKLATPCCKSSHFSPVSP